jgi:hypothetical protein
MRKLSVALKMISTKEKPTPEMKRTILNKQIHHHRSANPSIN